MGAAGLTSSSVEMAGKGGLGIELDLDQVPVRETGMTPYEIMLSRKPGAHADDPEARQRGRGAPRSSRNGSSISRSSAGSPKPAGWCCACTARSRPTCRSSRWSPRRRSTSGPGVRRRPRSRARCRQPAGRAIRSTALQHPARLPRPRLQALDLGAVRSPRHGQHGAAAGRRCRGRPRAATAARRWRSPPTARRAIASADPEARRRAGGRRELAQPDRGRRACRSRSPTT